jgi:hypothetical protein
MAETPAFSGVPEIFALSLWEAIFAPHCEGCENSWGFLKSENWTTFDGLAMSISLQFAH